MEEKDYSSISPSAKSLLLMKGYTGIPYAKETAALMQGPEVFDLNFDDKDMWFWMRVMHFENRYWTIDQLLKKTTAKNIMELSSGYSLRGLDMCTKGNVHYIDTDLADVIAIKKQMMQQMGVDDDLKGKLELLALNAIDASAFKQVADKFEAGPITIVNEGLLMYLNIEEKKQLCHTIRDVLAQHGGCWITADVYIKQSPDVSAVTERMQTKSEAKFLEQHRIEENKFESYEIAQAFFESQGFELIEEAIPDFHALSATSHLLKTLPPEVANSKEPPPKIQATWMLRAK